MAKRLTVGDSPKVVGTVWARRAYRMLAEIPALPASDDPELSPYARMYSAHEARAWVASNLMWFEESLDLLLDARSALAFAAGSYGTGFPSALHDGLLAMPGVLVADDGPRPEADRETVERARWFRYHVDDAVIRISAMFHKVAGLLASYYSIESVDRKKLMSELRRKCPGEPLIERLGHILGSEAFRKGQEYRNPRIHSLGASCRALYGGRAELCEVVVVGGGGVGLKPRQEITAERLFDLAKGFYGAGVDFLRTGVGLIQEHPLVFTRDRPFVARRIQNPELHKAVGGDKRPVDFTSVFSVADQKMFCTALVHSAKGRVVGVRWYLNGRLVESDDMTVAENNEHKVTACIEPNPGRGLSPGRGYVEWWLDDERLWKVPFSIAALDQEKP